MGTFTQDVEALLRRNACGESIDDVYHQRGYRPRPCEKRADWLLRNQTVAVEFKELTEGQYPKKLFEMLTSFAAEVGQPHGFVRAADIINRHPDGQQLSGQIDEIVTDVLRKAVEESNSQLRDSKTALKLNRTLGLVVVFNTANGLMLPRHIGLAMDRQMLRRANRFGSVNAVAVLSPHLVVKAPENLGKIPFTVFPYPSPAGERAADAAEDLREQLDTMLPAGVATVRVRADGKGWVPIDLRHGEPVITYSWVDPAEVERARVAAHRADGAAGAGR